MSRLTKAELKALLTTGGAILASACRGNENDCIQQGKLNVDMEQLTAPLVASCKGFYEGEVEESGVYSINSSPISNYGTIVSKLLVDYCQDSVLMVIAGKAWLVTIGSDSWLDFYPFDSLTVTEEPQTGNCSAMYCTDGILWLKAK